MSLWNRDDVQSASMFHFITAKVMQGLYCLAMKRMQSAACEVVSKTERGKVNSSVVTRAFLTCLAMVIMVRSSASKGSPTDEVKLGRRRLGTACHGPLKINCLSLYSRLRTSGEGSTTDASHAPQDMNKELHRGMEAAEPSPRAVTLSHAFLMFDIARVHW